MKIQTLPNLIFFLMLDYGETEKLTSNPSESKHGRRHLMVLCDTNVLIEFYKDNKLVISELSRIGIQDLSCSVITEAELYFGALDKTELQKIKQHLSQIHSIPLDRSISQKFIKLMAQYSLSHQLSIPDALIAATSIVNDLELYTFNNRDFAFIDGIKMHKTR